MQGPPVSVLIPAAGASTRLGTAKQLLQYRGQPLLGHVLDVTASLEPHETIVVTGANAGTLRQTVRRPAVRWVHNRDWARGMGSSIALGAAAVSPGSGGVLIMLCDQYRVTETDLQALVQTWHIDPKRIVAAEAAGRCMPPVVFPAGLLGALESLAGDIGAHRLLEDHFDLLTTLAMENAAFDVDTNEQLSQMGSE